MRLEQALERIRELELILSHVPGCPVEIRGVRYPSIRVASKVLGLHYNAILRALNNGTVDEVGFRRKKPRPIALDGIPYDSIKAGSRATGIPHATLRSWLIRGNPRIRLQEVH